MQSRGIVGFFERLERRMDQLIAAACFSPSQHELLQATVCRFRRRTRANPSADPLALFYLIARAEQRELDEQGEALGVFCQFYLLALDLMDDVHDDDLAGKPYEQAGAARASNDALVLMFLGISSLEAAMRLEEDHGRALHYLTLLNRVALLTGRGQHADLLGEAGARTCEEVLEMQRAKTASLTLICEHAALYAGATLERCARYRRIGEGLSMLVQMLDDLRDIYGKHESPDLSGRKMTYPLACFRASASSEELERYRELTSQPDSLREIRQLFYSSGVVRQVAQAIEQQRRAIHHEVAALDAESPSLRTLLFIVDGLVSAIYSPQPIAESAALFAPRSAWHKRVRALAAEFRERLAAYDAPATPRLVPWHLPQWMYDPRHGVVFYPDLEGLPEETLSMQAALLGKSELDELRAEVEAQAPAVLAHELFHHYRDAAGRLTNDVWQEELAANALAVAYCREFEPDALERGLELARAVRRLPENQLSAEGNAILADLLEPDAARPGGSDYGVDLQQMAVVQLALVERLAERPEPLTRAVERYLRAH
jgi:geranylgeranyl pyrophosphate synthase